MVAFVRFAYHCRFCLTMKNDGGGGCSRKRKSLRIIEKAEKQRNLAIGRSLGRERESE